MNLRLFWNGIVFLSAVVAFLEIIFWTFEVNRLQLLDDVLQFFGERAIIHFMFALPVKFQAAAVQKQAVQPEQLFDFSVECKITVTCIAQKWVPDACEMGADLVHASCFEFDFYKVVAFVMLLDDGNA